MSRPTVLLVAFDDASVASLSSWLVRDIRVRTASSEAAALDVLADHEIAVVAVGQSLRATTVASFLRRAMSTASLGSSRRLRALVLAGGSDVHIFQDLVDADLLDYLCPEMPRLEDVHQLIRGAVSRWLRPVEIQNQDPLLVDIAIELTQYLDREKGMAGAALRLGEAAARLVGARHARCSIYDSENETLWYRKPSAGICRDSAVTGLAGFVVRTGSTLCLEHVGGDPRYEVDVDKSDGDDDRLLAVPVVDPETGVVLAVVTAWRRASSPPFSTDDQRRLEALAGLAAAYVSRLARRAARQRITRALAEAARGAVRFFRREALEAHSGSSDLDGGPVLQISPRWAPLVFWLILLISTSALLYSILGSIDDYATGPAVVRLAEATEATAAGEDFGEPAEFRVAAFFPERYRPQLTLGMPLRIKVPGYRGAFQESTIHAIGDEPLGIEEAQGLLGTDLLGTGLSIKGSSEKSQGGDAVAFVEPMVLVHARLTTSAFESGGRQYAFHDGLRVTVDVKVHSEPLLAAVVPGLGRLFPDRRSSRASGEERP